MFLVHLFFNLQFFSLSSLSRGGDDATHPKYDKNNNKMKMKMKMKMKYALMRVYTGHGTHRAASGLVEGRVAADSLQR
jgi:hypothetical protein